MTSANNTKVNIIEQSGRKSSSEESERKGRTKTQQKITLPIFEKKTIQEAKLWWRRFIQYVKMTQNIDLNTMTNDKEIIPEHREELEVKTKDIFIWALGEAAVTEMTKTVRDNGPNKMNINQLYSLFRLHFIPERNNFMAGQISSESQENRTKQRRTFGQGYYKRSKSANSIM